MLHFLQQHVRLSTSFTKREDILSQIMKTLELLPHHYTTETKSLLLQINYHPHCF
jgi:hypothetical protein